jgi:hypothetical protein
MDSHHDLEAHFDEPLPTCDIAVFAIEYCTQEPVLTNVYIDYEWVGEAWDIYEVDLGEHVVSGDSLGYVPGLGSYVYLWYVLVDGQFYGYYTSANVNVNKLHTIVTLVYIAQ